MVGGQTLLANYRGHKSDPQVGTYSRHILGMRILFRDRREKGKMELNITAAITAVGAVAVAQDSVSNTEMFVTAIVSVIGAICSFAGAAISYHQGKRKMYVDIVIRDRLQAIEERRCALKELYYYTNPDTIALVTDPASKSKQIQGLLKTQSALEHRLLGRLQPENHIICLLHGLVDSSIKYTKSGIKPETYDNRRAECLELLKIYNFASWQFAQKHSTGLRGSSVDGFDAAYIKTLESLKQEDSTVANIKTLLQSHNINNVEKKDNART